MSTFTSQNKWMRQESENSSIKLGRAAGLYILCEKDPWGFKNAYFGGRKKKMKYYLLIPHFFSSVLIVPLQTAA